MPVLLNQNISLPNCLCNWAPRRICDILRLHIFIIACLSSSRVTLAVGLVAVGEGAVGLGEIASGETGTGVFRELGADNLFFLGELFCLNLGILESP